MGKKKCEFSDFECSIILEQITRRARYRKEYLIARTDPCKHTQQAGYVFDPWIQRFISMKQAQIDYFKPSFRTTFFGICAIVLPMFLYGTAIYIQRSEKEELIRCGKLRPKDRIHKLV